MSGGSDYSEVQKEYTRINNQVRRKTRKDIKKTEIMIVQNVKSNPNIFLKYVQSKTKSAPEILELYKDKERLHNTNADKEKAEVLASFLSQVYTREPLGPLSPTRLNSNCVLSNIVITR